MAGKFQQKTSLTPPKSMRTRKEIIRTAGSYETRDTHESQIKRKQDVIIELLLDIRDLLSTPQE